MGAATNTVTVNGGPPLLETDRADVSTILNARAVSDLPNLERNFTEFELLTPGTTYIGWSVGQATNPQQSQQIEVNGQLPFATGYELDGTDNQDPIQGVAVINPNLDAVSEMKVTSQNYDAEFGTPLPDWSPRKQNRAATTSTDQPLNFAVPTRSRRAIPLPSSLPAPYRRLFTTNLADAIGGPIKKDKLFFFGDYQGLREKTGATLLDDRAHGNWLITAAFRAATAISATISTQAWAVVRPTRSMTRRRNPAGAAGRTPFAGNIIPGSPALGSGREPDEADAAAQFWQREHLQQLRRLRLGRFQY